MLEYLRRFGEASTDSKDQATGQGAGALLVLRDGKDIPFPQTNKSEHLQDELEGAIQEYKTQPLTSELVTATWQTFLRISVEKSDLNSLPVGEIPVCNRSQGELKQLRKEGRSMVYVPNVDYPLLGKIFPEMQSYSVQEGSLIKDEYQSHGWVDVEADLESPNRNTTEKDLEKMFKAKGKRGQTLKTYIWASQFSKALTGHYLDEKESWSRLLGSRSEGDVVSADFPSNGSLYVDWHPDPQHRHSDLGGRSEGVKKS